jgi:hypothetical protein
MGRGGLSSAFSRSIGATPLKPVSETHIPGAMVPLAIIRAGFLKLPRKLAPALPKMRGMRNGSQECRTEILDPQLARQIR